METQKIINLLDNTENEYSTFATKKWHITDSEPKGNYSHQNPIRFLTNSLESSLCDYSDAYILVTGSITVTGGDNDTKVVFENCAPFNKCRTEINETFVDEADIINITMPVYNLLEYSDNYSDTSGRLWNFKKDEIKEDADLTINNASSFKYKANLIGNTITDGVNRKKENIKMVVPLKYLSIFWTPLEIAQSNCKVEFSLGWYVGCILSNDGNAATFTITDAKRYVPIVTLRTEDNKKLSKLLSEGFERPIYWNKYKVILETTIMNI